jgi:hypothetical protein
MRTTRLAAAALACTIGLGAGLVGCAGEPAVCADVDALQTSAEDLRAAEPGEGGLEVVTEELQDIEDELQQLKTDAASEYSTQVKAVEDAFAALRTSAASATSDPSSTTLAQVRDDLRSFGSAVSSMGSAVEDTC